MAILHDQAHIYLALEGHLPETYLLERLFGESPEEARKIAEQKQQEYLQNSPAVMAIRIKAARKALAEELGVSYNDDEQVDIENGQVKVTTRFQGEMDAQPKPEGGWIFKGLDHLPPFIQEEVKQAFIEQMGPTPPDGQPNEVHFGPGLHQIIDPLMGFNQEDDDGDDED